MNFPAQMSSADQLQAGSIREFANDFKSAFVTSLNLYFENVIPRNSLSLRMSLISGNPVFEPPLSIWFILFYLF
jgi:hypothetical protein